MKNILKIINFSSFEHNIFCIKQKNPNLCAVVKADAYGHGIKNVVPFLNDKVGFFAVNTIKEAKKVRKYSNKPILVLCGFLPKDLCYASQNNIHLAVFCKKQLYNIQKFTTKHAKNVCLHLKFDTGMNRLGFKNDCDLEEIKNIICSNKHIKLCGIFTHFGGGSDERALTQIKQFENIAKLFSDGLIVHSKSSSYFNCETQSKNEMLRCGLALYGYGGKNLKPILSIKAKIIFVGNAKKGEPIGYGTNHIAKQNTNYAVLAIGYADGLPRSYAKNGYVLIGNQKAKICANICMNMTIVNVNNIDACVGDYATIMDENLNAEVIAKKSSTICYEILTNFR